MNESLVVPASEMQAFDGLFRSLIPRAQSFAFYDAQRQCVWRSNGDSNNLIDAIIKDFRPSIEPGGAAVAVELSGSNGNPLFVLPISDQEQNSVGFLTVEYSSEATTTAAMLTNLLAPVVLVLLDSLTVRRRYVTDQQQLIRAQKQLNVIYSLDSKLEQSPHGQASLSFLVGSAARHLRIGYSVLLMPVKRIRISVTHPDWKRVDRNELDKLVIRQFFPGVCEQNKSTVIELRDLPGGVPKKYDTTQIILCPIREGNARVTGVLALFAQTEGNRFTGNDENFVDLVARKTERIIELNYDPMTGLMNRSGFESHIREAYGELAEHDDEHCLMYIDIDKLQLLNDTFDQRAGDEVLVRFANELQQVLPESGVASRLSGGDFGVLLPHTDLEKGVEFAELLRASAHKMSYLKADKSHQITISVGVAPLRVNDDGHGGALIPPKVACTAAKDHGRDRVEVYDQDNHSIVRRVDDMQIVGQIHNALSAGDFRLVAQPIAALNSKQSSPHFEVLVRMCDSAGGILKPEAFFSAAERYQLMPRLDRWVVKETMQQLAKHRESILALQPVFAINLSGQSMQDDTMLDYVLEQIRSNGIPPRALCFEITETAAVANMMTAKRLIASLKKMGCKFSLDDFGAGLSSFGYLKTFDVDNLKIDGSFVRDVATNKVSESMVAAITQVAQVMGLNTIAEYVETEEARLLVEKLGVDFAQGYLIGEPQDFAETLAEMTASSSITPAAAASV